jgi:hypothetical protein
MARHPLALVALGFATTVTANLTGPLSAGAKPNANPAQQSGKPIEGIAIKIQKQLENAPEAIALSETQLRNYANFKTALTSLVRSTYKPIVRTTDDGFIDAVLKPIYNNLIIRRLDNDKKFGTAATIQSFNAKLGISRSREILLYQEVRYIPSKVFSCSDSNRTPNLPCINFDKNFTQFQAQYAKQPDLILEQQVAELRSDYDRDPNFAKKLKGWDFDKLTTLQAAYVGMAALPQSRSRGSQFLPAAVFVYANPSDGEGSPSGQEGPSGNQVPSGVPGHNHGSPGPTGPGTGNLRSHSSYNTNSPIARELDYKTNRSDLKALVAMGNTTPIPILAPQPSTAFDKGSNGDTQIAWTTSQGGRQTNYNLLNGFTKNYRASIGDNWTLYNKWWTPRYWFGFELGYGYVYGIRAGFDVQTTATLSIPAQRQGTMDISMDTGNKGIDTFSGSGLTSTNLFDGKEILARVCQQRSCYVALLGDIPGPDPLSTSWTRWTFDEIDFLKMLPSCADVRRSYGPNTKCDALNQLRKGEYRWPNVGKSVDLARWISPLDLFGHQLDYGIVGAKANPYLALKTTGLNYRQQWRKAPSAERNDIHSDNSTLTFGFSGLNNRANPVVTGINNEYDFNFSITPGIALGGNVGPWGLGPWTMDIEALAIDSPTLTLSRHDRTYNGFWTAVPAGR